jgi:hypothetical protein
MSSAGRVCSARFRRKLPERAPSAIASSCRTLNPCRVGRAADHATPGTFPRAVIRPMSSLRPFGVGSARRQAGLQIEALCRAYTQRFVDRSCCWPSLVRVEPAIFEGGHPEIPPQGGAFCLLKRQRPRARIFSPSIASLTDRCRIACHEMLMSRHNKTRAHCGPANGKRQYCGRSRGRS